MAVVGAESAEEMAPKIYFKDAYYIRRCNLDGSEVESLLLIKKFPTFHFFQVDAGAGLYWSKFRRDSRGMSLKAGSLMYSEFNGADSKKVFDFSQSGGSYTKEFVVNKKRGKVYWHQRYGGRDEGRILQGSLDDQSSKIIYRYQYPTGGLTLDPPDTGRVYWFVNEIRHGNTGSQRGRMGKGSIFYFDPTISYHRWFVPEYGGEKPGGKIRRANFGLVFIMDLAIDPEEDKIYWSVKKRPDESYTGYKYYLRRVRDSAK